MSEKNYRAIAAWIATCIIWGTTYLAIRIGVTDLPPMLFAGFRWIIAGPLFLVFLLIKGYKLPRGSEFVHIAIVGIALIGVANGLVVVAEQWVPSGLTALLISTLPFWVVIIESILPEGIKLNIKIVGGLFLGFVGVAMIFGNSLSLILEVDYLIGMGCVMVGMISWASGSIYTKYHKINVHPLVSASFQMIFAGIAQIIVGIFLGELSEFVFTANSLWAFTYLVFVGSMLGYGSYIYAIAHLPVSFVTTYAYINPVIALVLGWIVLSEELNILIIVAASIILFGVWLVKKGSKV